MNTHPLGEALLEAGRITPAQLAAAVARQREKGGLLGEALVDLGYLSDQDIAQALSAQLRIPYMELGDDFRMEKEDVRLIPESVARRFCVVPLRRNDGRALTLVMKDPLDVAAIDAVRSLTALEVHKAVSTEKRILAVINRCYREEAHIERNLRDIIDLETGGGESNSADEPLNAEQLRVQANDAPVVKFVNLLLMQAVRDRASDIHFEPGEHSVTVRLRVDGVLREITPPPKALYQAIVTRIKILSNMDIAERRLPLDGRFKFAINNRVIDVRVSSLPESYGEKLVLRLLDREALLVDMKDIGFDPDMLARFQRHLRSPHGIILLTGPTGSGKTTTLYSALCFLRSPEVNIQTVEDPVEYQIPGVNQMPTRPKIGLDFANALRSILRQDPDIIMIGEIRDIETARIAMQSSLTGHLVLSTLHTNDSPSAFVRLRDIGVEPYLIAATMKLVISQRLVRSLCGKCRRPANPPAELIEAAAAVCPDIRSWQHYAGDGCVQCGNTGYRGRTGIFEFLEASDSVRQMVLSGAGAVEFRKRCVEEGMEPLLLNGLRKVRAGVTTVEEVLSAAPLDESA